MPGRHSSDARARRRLLPAALVTVVAAALGAGGFVMLGQPSTGDPVAAACTGTLPVRLAAAPEIAGVLEKATREVEKDGAAADGVCVDFKVSAATPADVATTAAGGNSAEIPQLWVPDSSLWVARVTKPDATSGPTVLSRSLGTSPLVVAGDSVARPASWLELLGSGEFAMADPTVSSTGAAALLAVQAERGVTGTTDEQVGAAMVPAAQRYGAEKDRPATTEQLVSRAEAGTPTVISEQQLVASGAQVPSVVPESGTLALDYPLVLLTPDPGAQAAGAALAVAMAGRSGVELLTAAHFRDTQLTPLPGGAGAGQVQALSAPDPAVASSALRQWAVLALPSRTLAVFDVSGSMDFADAGRPRIDLAVDAASTALKLFPDTAQIGFWAFSVGLGGGNRDYQQLVPVRALADQVGGGTQREALAGALRKLPSLTSGGTGLYDTTLAAIRTVQDGYDPRAVNSVILLTDGENDDPGSLTEAELLQTIERERDPARPVVVIAIGMGPEADAAALRKIAAATGGRSYIARDPSDITKVFQDALLSR